MNKKKISTLLILSVVMCLLIVIGNVASATVNDVQSDQTGVKSGKEGLQSVNPVKEKIKQEVKDKFDKMRDDETGVVAIWVASDDNQNIERATGSGLVAQETAAKEKNAQKVKPVVDALKAKKAGIVYQSLYAPIVFAKVNKKQLKDLESQSDVQYVTYETEMEPMTNTALPTVLLPPVWGKTSGSVKIAVVENQGIAFANPYLVDGIYYRPATPSVGSHATTVAGIIASTHPNFHGVLWNSPALLSANAQSNSDSNLIAATDWAISNNAKVISLNVGCYTCAAPLSYSAYTLYTDYVASHPPWITFVFPAGNTGPDCYMQNPAVAYNALTVGATNDKQTAYNWNDDDMYAFSTYRDSFSRQKPEVVAVGAHNRTTTSMGSLINTTIVRSPWLGSLGVGTSYSAPQVAGLAGNIMNRSITLSVWPETVRAIIMVSATHNIEGDSRLSDKDGAGCINMAEAIKIADNSRLWKSLSLTNTSFQADKTYHLGYMYLTKGQKVRMVIAWDSKITSKTGNDVLNEDLDFYVQQVSTLGLMASSISSYNNFEIIEFVVPADGAYDPYIYKFSWNDPAWWNSVGYAVSIQ